MIYDQDTNTGGTKPTRLNRNQHLYNKQTWLRKNAGLILIFTICFLLGLLNAFTM